jgi:hypothetical protein
MEKLVLVLILLFASRPADACKIAYHSVFRHFDDAATVAYGRMRAPGGKLALAVIETLKGSPGKQISLGIGGGRHTSCTPRLRGTGVMFLRKDRGFVAAYDSFPVADKELLAALRRYAAAKTHAERAAVLVEEIVSTTHARVASDAALELADDPAALLVVTPADRDRLLAKLPNARADSMIPIALARLGIPASKLTGHAADLATERKFEAVTNPGELADILAALPPTESARGVAAFERCERLRGRRLNDIRETIYASREWRQLADKCRATSP